MSDTPRPDRCYLCGKPVHLPDYVAKTRPEGEPPVCAGCCEEIGRAPWWAK